MHAKVKATIIVSVLCGLLISAASVFASPAPAAQAAKTPEPGQQATLDARGTQQAGALATKKAAAEATQNSGKLAGSRETFKGTVASESSDSLTLTLFGGGSKTFRIVTATHFRNAGGLADVHTGAHVLVQALKDDASATALFVAVIAPDKETPMIHRAGKVTAYTAGASITISDKDGKTATFAINASTTILPAGSQVAVGDRVTIVARGDVDKGPVTAHGIVVHPQTPAQS